jgi:hypothetical protein
MKNSWRPDDWPVNTCKDCAFKKEDEDGKICDLICGRFSHWRAHEDGADRMLKALRKRATHFHGCSIVLIPDDENPQ